MRRQTGAGASLPAGSSRHLRLDPCILPVRFAAVDPAADGRLRTIELDRARVIVSRTVRGVRMRLHLPLATFLGVAVRLLPARGDQADAIAIVLEHPDAALSVPLHVTADTDHVIADWQLWGRVLGKKLLVADSDGSLREPFATLGLLRLGRIAARRRRRTPLHRRRPKVLRRRGSTRSLQDMVVHRGEREIIAPE